MTDLCSCCEEEPASVTMPTQYGPLRLGQRCSRFIEYIALIFGEKLERRPALRVIK